MSSRAQQAQILRSQPVLDQLTGSLLAAAVAVINEGPTIAAHEQRLIYANAIMLAPAAAAQAMMPALLWNATLAGEAGNPALELSGTPFADGDVDYVVASVFSKYALQYVGQTNIGAPLTLGS